MRADCDLAEVIAVRKFHAERFLANKRMRKINGVRNGISLRRIDRDKFVAFVQVPAHGECEDRSADAAAFEFPLAE